jgi:hypothetical protein
MGPMRSRQATSDKSFTYFALLDAFGKSGCAVCRLMEEYSLAYLDALFYEQVNDVGIRRKLREARGFCNWHAWQARKIASSALGVAIIAKDLLTEEIARLDDLVRGSPAARVRRSQAHRIAPNALLAFIRGWRLKRICPACEIILEHERHALETILNFLAEADFARRFESSAALCVIHTKRLAEAHGSHPQLPLLIAMQRRKYAQLVGELEEFCRKHDYRFSHEPWGAEADSWLRAIELLAGKPDVFGNDVHRRATAGGGAGRWAGLLERCRRFVLGGTALPPGWDRGEMAGAAAPTAHQTSAHSPRQNRGQAHPQDKE